RQAAKQRKMTRKVPAWVVVQEAEGERRDYSFALDEVKAGVVRQIFSWCIAGYGSAAIAQKLNRKKVAPLSGKAALWHPSYVEKLLSYRGVTGEYQPRKKEGDKRVPVGDPIPGYFPRVVSDEDFRAAQQARASRRNSRGRITAKVTNLFTHL